MKLVLSLLAAMVVFSDARGCETADLIESMSRSGGVLYLQDVGRPESQVEWVTPDGRFRIHFDVVGPNAVYNVNEDENPADGIPDYVNRLADYLAQAYDSLVIGLGFDPPPSDGSEGGDFRYDIYLTDVTGLTTPESPSDQYPGRPAYTSFIQLGHDLRFPSRYGEDPYPFMRALASHEFFHSVEFAYRAYSSDWTAWWFESCANWAEEHVFDDLNDIYYNLPSYLHNSQRSLYATFGPFVYGAWLFPEFLEERFGPEIIRHSWEKFAGFSFAILAVDYTLRDNLSNFNDEFPLQAIWNYFTGPNFADGFYSEAADFPVTVNTTREHIDYPVDWVLNPVNMGNVASSYIVFRHRELNKGGLAIEYYNSTSDIQAVCIVKITAENSVSYSVYDVDTGVPSRFEIPEFINIDRVVMIPVWLYEGSPRARETSYNYRAWLDTTLVAISEEPGPGESFTLKGAYPNPFNQSVSIVFETPVSNPYRLKIYDITGRLLEEDNGFSNPGHNVINWRASKGISSGVFFYILDFGSSSLGGKMSLLK